MTPTQNLGDATLKPLSERVHGEILEPGDGGYDEARGVWNAKIDKQPAVIVRCTDADDVTAAVDFAREQDLPLAIRGGGHHIAGYAVCDDGIVIDLAPMNEVHIDADTQTVRVQGGAMWGDLNQELRAHGLEIVGNPYDEVGVAGYTLGGGMGLLSRKYGLAIDNLRSVEVVTADGELVHASDEENPEMFWALRGGSGNFGVVTTFEFDCHDVPPKILNGVFIHPITELADSLRVYREFMANAPNEVGAGVGVIEVPSTAEFPDKRHGESVTILLAYYLGDPEEGKRVLQPLQEFGDPHLAAVRPQGYSEVGTGLLEDGQRNHWKNHFFTDITDESITTFVEHALPLPEQVGHVNFFSLGGAINRVDETATAYPHRDANHLLEIVTQWNDPADDQEVISWAREVHEAMAPHATGGEYLNNQTDDNPTRAKAAYGDNYDRLAEIKTNWDPENLFHLNQNITPTD